MTYKEIKEMIESIGIPYTYYQFPLNIAPALPYIVFYYPSRDDEPADNVNFGRITQLNIELYTENKDFALESRVDSLLTANKFYYDKSESYIDTERMYEVLYESEVVLTNEN